mgnify:CR=1 FL=1
MNILKTPYYLVEERLLRRNLSLIRDVAEKSGVEIILAFKAFALWKTFPIFREYIKHTTASSPYEALLALNEFGTRAHTYSPAYTDDTFGTILDCSSHITFNSFSQYAHFWPQIKEYKSYPISAGIRINPEHSEIETELYNPCAPGSRFGVLASQLPDVLPEGISGFHCHCHCESDAEALEHTLYHIEEKFGKWLPQLKWLNLGGGHLMSRKGYNVPLLIKLLQDFRSKYPNLRIILEPGSAFAWQTGPLVASVVDIVENKGIKTAILDVSFTCHMPDCLEMPYQPAVRGAATEPQEGWLAYRLGGNSCLSGDFIDGYYFPAPLNIGDTVVLEDMIHYTTVKTTMFNGISHPDIAVYDPAAPQGKQYRVLREFSYADYESRMG